MGTVGGPVCPSYGPCGRKAIQNASPGPLPSQRLDLNPLFIEGLTLGANSHPFWYEKGPQHPSVGWHREGFPERSVRLGDGLRMMGVGFGFPRTGPRGCFSARTPNSRCSAGASSEQGLDRTTLARSALLKICWQGVGWKGGALRPPRQWRSWPFEQASAPLTLVHEEQKDYKTGPACPSSWVPLHLGGGLPVWGAQVRPGTHQHRG